MILSRERQKVSKNWRLEVSKLMAVSSRSLSLSFPLYICCNWETFSSAVLPLVANDEEAMHPSVPITRMNLAYSWRHFKSIKKKLFQQYLYSLITRQEEPIQHTILLNLAHSWCFWTVVTFNGTVHIRLMVDFLLGQGHGVFIWKEIWFAEGTFTVPVATLWDFSGLVKENK